MGGNSVNVSQAADSNYSGSTGTGTVTIGKAAASTSDTATGSGTYGAGTTPVTITIPYGGTAAPTGAITLTDTHSNTVTIAASSCTAGGGKLTCQANLPTANEPVGGNAVVVSQAADSNYNASTGRRYGDDRQGRGVDERYGDGFGHVRCGDDRRDGHDSVRWRGGPRRVLITVADTHSNTVTVAASTCTAGGGALTCVVNLPTANEPVGANAVTVSQVADGNYSASSGTGTVTIGKVAATSTDTVTGAGTYGAATTPVTVTIPYSGSIAPTGGITVADGFGNTVAIAASSCTAASSKLTCTANLPTASEPVGGNAATVTQAADSNYSGSTGTGTITIGKAAAGTGDTATGNGNVRRGDDCGHGDDPLCGVDGSYGCHHGYGYT